MAVVLDAGALIAIERRDPHLIAQLDRLSLSNVTVVTSSAVVARVLRDPARQVPLARVRIPTAPSKVINESCERPPLIVKPPESRP